jgi:hypothetical protein
LSTGVGWGWGVSVNQVQNTYYRYKLKGNCTGVNDPLLELPDGRI